MKFEKAMLGKLSILFAGIGLLLPFVLSFVSAVVNPDQPVKTPYLFILYMLIQATAISCAVKAINTREAKIGLWGVAASFVFYFTLGEFIIYRRNEDPKRKALAFYHALHDQNWRQLWGLTRFTGREREVWTRPELYEQAMRQKLQNPKIRRMFDDFSQVQDFTMANPLFDFDGAHLVTWSTIRRNGQIVHLQGRAHLIQQNGTWKVIVTENEWVDPYQGYYHFFGIPYHPESRK